MQALDDARRRRTDAGRVPPQNLQAEETLLGAMLLSKDAITAAVEICRADDFYKVSHGHIYDAIVSLYGQGEPADPVTVADELRRAGLIDAIGGPSTLVSLQANAGPISNAARYARIVEEHALLRRLIGVAGEIAELGYSVPDDVENAVDQAEALVFGVAQHRVADTMSPLHDLLLQSLDRLEMLYERGESITGTPTGYLDIDELLAGLQPSSMIIVGARPGAGKTSFALGMAAHAAVEAHKPVLFFSLEMSHAELTQRLLCAEAKVDSTRLRNGRLHDDDWGKISHAIGRLSDAPLFIDDNPNLTVMEIRAKARRLKSKMGDAGLGLVVVDYLQLMTGRRTAENRQVEVSEISRGLKILARELEVPVVALSQLSRNLEARADKRPILADLRESGCLTADARVLRADTGTEVTMGELYLRGETDIPVWSLDTDLNLVPATMTHVFSSGVKPVFELRLASGRSVKASANHPFLTVNGWARLDELSVGSRVAVPRRLPGPTSTQSLPEREIVMLAHLLGDGCVASRQPVHYTSPDPVCIAAVEDAAIHFGITPRQVRQGDWTHLYLPAPFRLTHGRRNPIQSWLQQWGLDGTRSHEKFVPAPVFSFDNDQLALFLRHLWATDGSLGIFRLRDGDRASIYYSTSSERLATDVQLLLCRFAILSRIDRVVHDRGRPNFQVRVIGSRSMRAFVSDVGVIGERSRHLAPILRRLESTTKDAYSEAMPRELNDYVRGRVREAALSHGALGRAAGMGTHRLFRSPLTRDRASAIASVLDDWRLRALASEDVNWDRVVAITPQGEEPVFDASVLETHNFVANGICLENSLEQDSDVVMFIYRDELYNADTPDKGVAEVIISKHRNGPTGKAHLAWIDRYTRFANMARV